MTKGTLVLLVAMTIALGGTGIAVAEHPDNGPGCGLGKLAWANYPNQQNIGGQVLQATTNGSFGTNTFGISSGTSGCTNDGTIFASEKVNVFTAVNFENLSQEMAQGHGENLTSLATLMGIPAEHQPEFFAMTQENYTTLIKSGETSPIAVIKALNESIATHPVLAKVTQSR